jgi:hypothetical protein
MLKHTFFTALLSCFVIVGCNSDSKDSGADLDLIQPTSREWTIVTSGWANDDCNATQNLLPPTSVVFTDVASPTFSVTFFDGDVRIGDGSSICTHTSDDIYDCEEFTHGLSYDDIDASVSMTGIWSVTVTSETAVSGTGDLTLTCTGSDCSYVAAATTTGELPCGTTSNWTAAIE